MGNNRPPGNDAANGDWNTNARSIGGGTPGAAVGLSNLMTNHSDSAILHEYRHDCGGEKHTLLFKVKRDGIELVCHHCLKHKPTEQARQLITWNELLAMLLMSLRLQGTK